MTILGIETSTRVGTLALVQEGKILGREIISDNLRHAGDFEASLKDLFEKSGLKKEDLTAIAVGLGPGSFTGIRIGLTIAKGLSLALNKPVWGVGTLDVLAHQISFPHSKVCPIIPGEGQEVYGAVYRRIKDGWEKTVPEFNRAINDLPQLLGEGVLLFGPGLEKQRFELEKLFEKNLIHQELLFPEAGFTAKLAQNQKWRQEGHEAVPRYIKPPPFVKK
jgi:tRNA threonylcarbamoyladenosine biosynthesis protein TsaB